MKFRVTEEITRKQFIVLTTALMVMMGGFFVGVSKESKALAESESGNVIISTIVDEEEISKIEPSREHLGIYDTGFKYYPIPEGYTEAGGNFPQEVQSYLWSQCKERGIDYYIAVALIERESGYRSNATGDSGDSKGYMQVQEKWHKKRMEEEAVADLYNPYENISVGLNFLEELYSKYNNWSLALMCYHRGESGAKRLWKNGIYETEYSAEIQDRAQEIRQEIE